MGEFLKDGQNEALNAVKASALFVGLGTGAPPTDLSTWTNITEVTDTNYVRKAVLWTENTIDVTGKHITENSEKIDWTGWAFNQVESITYAFVTDQLSGTTGKLIASFNLTTTINPQAGQPASVAVGGLDITLD